MAKKRKSSKRPVKKGGKFFPALCNILGTLILLAVIAASLPLALPRLLGYEAYNVESGSMEPAIPVGSVVYVEAVEPGSVAEGDIIAFSSNGTVVTHRVVENHYFYNEFITKGDANEKEDIRPVSYDDLIGKVKWHFPVVGQFLMVYSKQITKVYLLALAACGVMFNILAGRMRTRHAEKFQEELARYERRRAAKAAAELEAVRRKTRYYIEDSADWEDEED